MTATYTFDVFASLDGYGSLTEEGADWGGYWGKQGPELLDHRKELLGGDQRMVFGATTYREFASMIAAAGEYSEFEDEWVVRMRNLPLTVISSTLREPLDWHDARVVSGDAVEIVTQMKAESDAPIRSHGSLSLNHALMAAGLVDRVHVTVFPVITAKTGTAPVFGGAGDYDLELLESRTLDGRTQELVYRPIPHRHPGA
ncbi:dihydrofolate reductase family protein [Cumulibacter manganitolerans]|uniref:dihydrofolate reductase family protein n=1 Tax=Cumulibacter manganitolerans TaxID=1884992 RepID=UPI0012960354|nr:dihydrofolate reductase family protein [Cumulibacter manganitolerans]